MLSQESPVGPASPVRGPILPISMGLFCSPGGLWREIFFQTSISSASPPFPQKSQVLTLLWVRIFFSAFKL